MKTVQESWEYYIHCPDCLNIFPISINKHDPCEHCGSHKLYVTIGRWIHLYPNSLPTRIIKRIIGIPTLAESRWQHKSSRKFIKESK